MPSASRGINTLSVPGVSDIASPVHPSSPSSPVGNNSFFTSAPVNTEHSVAPSPSLPTSANETQISAAALPLPPILTASYAQDFPIQQTDFDIQQKLIQLGEQLTAVQSETFSIKTLLQSFQSKLDMFQKKTVTTSSTQTDFESDDQVEIRVPISNRFTGLETNINQCTSSTSQDFQISTKDKKSSPKLVRNNVNSFASPAGNMSQSNSPSFAATVLSRLSIVDKAKAVLIGDSVIRYINPRRMTIPGTFLQKVCVPGMTSSDLQHWLETLPVNTNVETVTVHVGVNDCSAGPITEDSWSTLIDSVRRVFPGSNVIMSSIVPAKGNSHLNNCIFPSNRNLSAACRPLKVDVISHNSFRSPSGWRMYADNIHLNNKGTAQLAINLKKAATLNHLPEQSSLKPVNVSETSNIDLRFKRDYTSSHFRNTEYDRSRRQTNIHKNRYDCVQHSSQRIYPYASPVSFPPRMSRYRNNVFHSTESQSIPPNAPPFQQTQYYHKFFYSPDRKNEDYPSAFLSNPSNRHQQRLYRAPSPDHTNINPNLYSRQPASFPSPLPPLSTPCFPPLKPHPLVHSLVH